MRQVIDKENIIIHSLAKWKSEQNVHNIAFKKLYDYIKPDDELIIMRKMDGELSNCRIKGGDAKFGSTRGRIRMELPVLNELKSILKSKGITNAEIIGDLIGVDEKGNQLPPELITSILKNPLTPQDDERIAFYPYDFYTKDSKYETDTYENYKKVILDFQTWFKSAKHIIPVEVQVGDKELLKRLWNKWILHEESDGLMVRSKSKNVTYKLKPYFSWNVCIVAVGNIQSENWKKHIASNVITAFMDSDKVFRYAGRVSSGFIHEEKTELYNWANDNYISMDSNFIWVKPKRIIEVKWDRHSVDLQSSWAFDGKKYIQVEDRLSAIGVKPHFMKYLQDKKVTPSDLKLNQIPEWELETKQYKKAYKLAQQYFNII